MNKILHEFGQALVRNIRDASIESCIASLSGEHRSADEQWMAAFDTMTDEQRRMVERLVRWHSDQTLAHMLEFIENSGKVKLTYGHRSETIDVGEASDGLAGELFGRRGWLARYGRYTTDFGG